MKLTLQNVKRQFDQWRSRKKTRGEKIPEELLRLAGGCCFKFGYSKTFKELNLYQAKLKEAMELYGEFNETKNIENIEEASILPKMEFLEVQMKQAELDTVEFYKKPLDELKSQPVVYELENKYGVRLRVFSDSEILQKNIFSAFLQGG